MSFEDLENIDGVRFNWNVFPTTRLEASQIATPLGCLYTPLHQRPQGFQAIPIVEGVPIRCTTCRNFINPFIKVDRKNQMWWCPFCQNRSYLPDKYQIPETAQSVDDWPIELRETSSTLDYRLPEDVTAPIAPDLPYSFLFIIDLYQHRDDIQDGPFDNLKRQIIAQIEKIPDGSLVGLVTFEENVNVHKFDDTVVMFTPEEFGTQKEPKKGYKYIFQHTTVEKVLKRIGIEKQEGLLSDWRTGPLLQNQIFLELTASNRHTFTDLISNLNPKSTDTYRPARSSGLANYISTLLLSTSTHKNFIGKALFFTAGPCTNFPGRIIDLEENQPIRSHHDIANLNAPNFIGTSKFYKCLALIANGQSIENSYSITISSSKKTCDYEIIAGRPSWSVDYFIGSLDQVGLFEMKSLVANTMGTINMFDTFSSYRLENVLQNSIDISGVKSLNRLCISTSQDLKVSKLIGDVGYALPSSYGQSEKYYHEYGDKISDNLTKFDSPLTKKAFTNQWSFNSLTSNVTLGILFDMNTKKSSAELTKNGTKEVYIQFQFKYWEPIERIWVLRVTTIQKPTTLAVVLKNQPNSESKIQKLDVLKEHELLKSFDQKSWIVLLSKLLIQKIDTTLGFDNFEDLIGLLDSTLTKLLFNFGGLSLGVQDHASSNPYLKSYYTINENFKLLPSYVYNLRKNPQLLRIFNSSPDETAYYHSWFLRMSCEDSLDVIEPALYLISKEKQDRITLDSRNLEVTEDDSTFFVLDNAFQFIIYNVNGSLNLHSSYNDEYFTENRIEIQAPREFIAFKTSQSGRTDLVPNIILTQANHSQQRYLVSRLNPVDKDDEQPQVELEEKEPLETPGFWGFLKSYTRSSPAPSYKIMKTDDLSLKQYYDGLIELIKAYTIEGDF